MNAGTLDILSFEEENKHCAIHNLVGSLETYLLRKVMYVWMCSIQFLY